MLTDARDFLGDGTLGRASDRDPTTLVLAERDERR